MPEIRLIPAKKSNAGDWKGSPPPLSDERHAEVLSVLMGGRGVALSTEFGAHTPSPPGPLDRLLDTAGHSSDEGAANAFQALRRGAKDEEEWAEFMELFSQYRRRPTSGIRAVFEMIRDSLKKGAAR